MELLRWLRSDVARAGLLQKPQPQAGRGQQKPTQSAQPKAGRSSILGFRRKILRIQGAAVGSSDAGMLDDLGPQAMRV